MGVRVEEIEITIVNWEKYNPQEFKSKYPHWFRMNKDTLQSQSLFELEPAERWVWIGLLCLACEKKTPNISCAKKWLAHRLGVTAQVLDSAIKKLLASSSLEVYSKLLSSKCPSTEHNSTLQDVGGEKTGVRAILTSDPIKPFLEEHGIPTKTVKLWGKKYGAVWVCDTLLSISAEFNAIPGDQAYKNIPVIVRLRQMLEKRWKKEQLTTPKKYDWSSSE